MEAWMDEAPSEAKQDDVTESDAKPTLDALVSFIGRVLTGSSRERFAVAQRLSAVGQAIMREVGPPRADDWGQYDEGANGLDGLINLPRRLRPPPPLMGNGGIHGLPDNVAIMRQAFMMLSGQSAATEAKQEADEVACLNAAIDGLPPEDPQRAPLERRRHHLIERIGARAAGPDEHTKEEETHDAEA